MPMYPPPSAAALSHVAVCLSSFCLLACLFVCMFDVCLCITLLFSAAVLLRCLKVAITFTVRLHAPLCSCTSLNDISLVEPLPACLPVCLCFLVSVS